MSTLINYSDQPKWMPQVQPFPLVALYLVETSPPVTRDLVVMLRIRTSRADALGPVVSYSAAIHSNERVDRPFLCTPFMVEMTSLRAGITTQNQNQEQKEPRAGHSVNNNSICVN